jgi:hypothetical protein
LYGCETWSLTFKKKHRLKVFENRVLRRIFGPKRDDNGRMEKVALITICYGDEIKENKMGGASGTHGRERKVYKVLVGKLKEKRPLKTPRHRWEDVIKMDLRYSSHEGVEWFGLVLVLVGSCEHSDVSLGSGATEFSLVHYCCSE